MPDLKAARMFLRMAKKDLSALGGMVEGEPFADEIFGFHAQQAIEKALKAWLCLVCEKVPRTHDLQELVALLTESGEDVPCEFADLVDFADFAVEFRYSELELDAEDDRQGAAEVIASLLAHVESLVSEAGRADLEDDEAVTPEGD